LWSISLSSSSLWLTPSWTLWVLNTWIFISFLLFFEFFESLLPWLFTPTLRSTGKLCIFFAGMLEENTLEFSCIETKSFIMFTLVYLTDPYCVEYTLHTIGVFLGCSLSSSKTNIR